MDIQAVLVEAESLAHPLMVRLPGPGEQCGPVGPPGCRFLPQGSGQHPGCVVRLDGERRGLLAVEALAVPLGQACGALVGAGVDAGGDDLPALGRLPGQLGELRVQHRLAREPQPRVARRVQGRGHFGGPLVVSAEHDRVHPAFHQVGRDALERGGQRRHHMRHQLEVGRLLLEVHHRTGDLPAVQARGAVVDEPDPAGLHLVLKQPLEGESLPPCRGTDVQQGGV